MHWVDLIIFVAMLVISILIGVYSSLTGGRQRTTSEYLMGDHKLNVFPVTMSMMASFMSSILMLGFPAEVYAHGSEFSLIAGATTIGAVVASFVFVQVFHPLHLTSVNEYLEKRYDSKLVSVIGCTCAIIQAILYVGNVYFGPSTAIESVTGFPTWGSILIGSGVCLVYTTIGGIKAVIWTDVFQSFLMLIGIGTVAVQATLSSGGIVNAWQLNRKWDRTDFFDFDPNFTKRLNFWGILIGKGLHMAGVYGFFQPGVQRYSSMPTIAKARIVVLGTIPGTMALAVGACYAGFVVFAVYANIGCDPLKAGYISNPNQIMPYYVKDGLIFPGLLGLFLAGVCAASLSTASSSLNAAAANVWRDILRHKYTTVTERTAANITKSLVVVFGILGTAWAMIVMQVGGTVVQIMWMFSACVVGPMYGMFTMGIFMPWINWIGAAGGSVAGFGVGLWVAVGQQLNQRHKQPLPSPTYNCSLVDHMSLVNSTLEYTYTTDTIDFTTGADIIDDNPDGDWVQTLYSISFVWLLPLAAIVTIVSGNIFAILSGCSDISSVEARYIHPCLRTLFNLRLTDDSTKPTPPKDCPTPAEDDQELQHKAKLIQNSNGCSNSQDKSNENDVWVRKTDLAGVTSI